jgi:hypothetical protein
MTVSVVTLPLYILSPHTVEEHVALPANLDVQGLVS